MLTEPREPGRIAKVVCARAQRLFLASLICVSVGALLLPLPSSIQPERVPAAEPAFRPIVVHKLTVPAPPAALVRHLRGGGLTWFPVGVDRDGDILLEVSDRYAHSELARYSPHRKGWLKGVIDAFAVSAEGSSAIVESDPYIWMVNYGPPGTVLRARFSTSWSKPKVWVAAGAKHRWRSIEGIAVDGRGRIWVSGSGGRSLAHYSCSYDSAASEFVCGYSELGTIVGHEPTKPMRMTRGGTETAMAVGPGASVWLVVPDLKGCRHSRCPVSALVRYEADTGRTRRWIIPYAVWPGAAHQLTDKERRVIRGGGEINLPYENTNLYTSTNGTVWIESWNENGTRLISFRKGAFASRFSGGGPDDSKFMDRNGDLWYTSLHGVPTVIDPATGAKRVLPYRGGTPLRRRDGSVWYIWASPVD